jgi:maltose-binding protein MalE
MKVNKTYRSLLDKSINSMLSAIEIYNKPNFSYREETFAILAVNSWELILKAHLLKKCSYNMNNLYVMEPVLKANGEKSTRKKPKLNRVNNPMTIGIFDVIKRIEEKGIIISENLKNSIESLVELRDNAIHFHNEKEISKEL